MRHPLFFLTLPLCIIGSLTSINTVTAQQVTSDGTVSTTVTTPDGKNFNINDGTTRGGNLFHSFKEFSVPTGGSANFNNPTYIQNIIGRVTGGSVSNIDGLIRTLGRANLFLLNPAGIIFGPNASLNIGGSFLGSTANSFVFNNGFEFSATNPQAPPLLTITAPVGLSYRENFKNISNQSRPVDNNGNLVGLSVSQGNYLTLVGGNVNLDGGILVAPGGRVELGGLSAPGTVGLNSDGSLSFPVGVQRGDVSLTNGAIAYVRSGAGGSIAVNARNLDISGGSGLYAGIERGLGTVGSQGGDITLDATGDIKVVGSYVLNNVRSQGVGNAGNINITTGSLSLTDGAQLIASTLGKGNAGNVKIAASDTISFDGISSDGSPSGISSSVGSGVVGGGGGIKIEQQRIIDEKGLTEPQVFFRITIEPFRNTFFPDATGNTGSINIATRSLSVTNGARLTTSTFGRGDAGNIAIQASDKISFDGVSSRDGSPSGAFSAVQSEFFGTGGDLNITTGLLSVTNGAQLVTSTLKKGNAGNITLNVRDAVFDGVNSKNSPSGVFAAVDTNAEGKGGDITIKAESVSVTQGAQLAANSRGRGDAGNILITADTALFQGFGSNGLPSRASSAVETGAVGNGGNLRIIAGRFNVLNGAEGTVSNQGSGNAGNLEVIANSINLDDQGKLTANSANGFGGDIILQARDLLLLRRNSLISAISGTPGSDGQDGNININTKLLVAFPQENSDITATGFGRTAGSNVQVNISKPGGIFGIQYQPQVTPNSDIVATGTVTVTNIDLDPTQGLFELTETVVDPAQQVAQNPCIKGFGNSFTITGRGGLPTDPQKALSSDNVRVDLIKPVASTVSSTSTTQKQPSKKPPVKQIIPVQGWIYNEKGQVVLVGYDPTKTGPQRQQPAPNSNCAAVK